MQLDSVMVRCGSAPDVRRLCRAGGEVWQECGQVTTAGGVRWRYAVVKLPAAAAIRLGLIVPGAELAEVAEVVARAEMTPAARAGVARVRPPLRRGPPGPDGDAA